MSKVEVWKLEELKKLKLIRKTMKQTSEFAGRHFEIHDKMDEAIEDLIEPSTIVYCRMKFNNRFKACLNRRHDGICGRKDVTLFQVDGGMYMKCLRVCIEDAV